MVLLALRFSARGEFGARNIPGIYLLFNGGAEKQLAPPPACPPIP